MDKAQRLRDIELIKGEYFAFTIDVKNESGVDIDITSLATKLEVNVYGFRDTKIFSVNGTRVDMNKATFKLPSSVTNTWTGKLEYTVTVSYSNGDSNIGIGYITMV